MPHPDGYKYLARFITIAMTGLLGILAVAAWNAFESLQKDDADASNCMRIILALKQYAHDHQGQYPDSVVISSSGTLPVTSNDAFRELVKARIVTDERIFGNWGGIKPDGLLGEQPHFAMALSPNENHWAMTSGLTDSSAGNTPLVFEHPAENSWPPKWLPAGARTQSRNFGFASKRGHIVIGLNDGSVFTEKIVEQNGLLLPKKDAQGLDLFTRSVPQSAILAPIITGPILCQ